MAQGCELWGFGAKWGSAPETSWPCVFWGLLPGQCSEKVASRPEAGHQGLALVLVYMWFDS